MNMAFRTSIDIVGGQSSGSVFLRFVGYVHREVSCAFGGIAIGFVERRGMRPTA